ncbi:Facilitated trehalose transporter Tret1 [Eumeta japonica]|uniref:Facilitated trehalose transporter Tret1 n=1 Tax=Eumeta variegata TaxID=151549 RepID=A0A4C1XIE7_EUMVA|nr:Facilitated trehalose transporter Tret1 [Eumeta japonica]
MVTATVFMGFVVVQVYADPLFRETVPSMSPTSCNIIFALVSIIATMVTAVVVDKVGRKMLMLYSSGASAVVTLLLGTQLHVQWGPHMLTAVLIYIFCFAFSIGAGTIPYILVYEVFLPEIKSFCSMLVLEWAWLTSFLILLIFNPLVECLGLGPVFYIFSAFCVLTSVFCCLFQPETKGLPLDVIVTLFTAPNRRTSIYQI